MANRFVITSFETPSAFRLAPGCTIVGKWGGRRYVVERLLGEGAGGAVYAVRSAQGLAALKFGRDALSLQSEINAVHTLIDRGAVSPDSLLDADDWRSPDGVFLFMWRPTAKAKTSCGLSAAAGRTGSAPSPSACSDVLKRFIARVGLTAT